MSKTAVVLMMLGSMLALPLAAEPVASAASATTAAPAQPASALALPVLDGALPDLQQRRDILQAVLESFTSLGLNTVDRPGNIPPNAVPDKAVVVALTAATEERLPVSAFGRPVQYLTRSDIRERMLINFIKIDSLRLVDATHAEVRLFYPYRALGGTVTLQLRPTGWQADTSGLSFHPPGAQLFFSQLFDGKTCVDGTEYARWKNAFQGRRDGQCGAAPSPGRKTRRSG